MNAIQTPPSAVLATTRGSAKWGDVALAGFQVVPDALLMHQHELGLSPTDLGVLLNVLSHWWEQDRLPFPRPGTIADRMNLDVRTVQRSIRKLIELGYAERCDIERPGGRVVRALDMTGLVLALDKHVRTNPRLSTRLEKYKQIKMSEHQTSS